MQYKKICAGLLAVAVVAIGVWLWKKQDKEAVVSPDVVSNESGGASGSKDDGAAVADSVDSSEWSRRWTVTGSKKDLDSVVATFKEANDCLVYHTVLGDVRDMLSDEQWNNLSSLTPEALKRMDASSARSALVVQRMKDFCDGSDQKRLAAAFNSALFEAALQGNHDAEACFVLAGPTPWDTPGVNSSAESESQLNRYLKYAPAFSQKALERADPRVAARALFRYVASPPVHPSPIDDLAKDDPLLTRRAARLASLRAIPEQRARLESYLSDFEKKEILSPAEIADADRWAAEAFRRDFSGQAPINVDSPVQCYASADLAP